MTNNSKSKHRVTLFLDSNILKQAKLHAIVEEISLSALLERILVKHLSEKINIHKAEIFKGRNAKQKL
jgi:hypothetical protein